MPPARRFRAIIYVSQRDPIGSPRCKNKPKSQDHPARDSIVSRRKQPQDAPARTECRVLPVLGHNLVLLHFGKGIGIAPQFRTVFYRA